jgi:murein DD-endopeptidase MepM/ murein hydrolase activator NlpD
VIRWRLSLLAPLGLLLMFPAAHFLVRTSEASPFSSSSFRPDLLLGVQVVQPALDQLARLDRCVIARYTVQPNEDVWSICHRYHLDQYTVRSSNGLDSQVLTPGTVLQIPNHKGTLYEVQAPESLQTIRQGFSMGRKLGTLYDRQILQANNYPLPDLSSKDFFFKAGTVLFLPDAFKPTGLPFPFVGNGHPLRITSGFGSRKHPILGVVRRHDGFDIAKPYGTPVLASREGVVVAAEWRGGYGNMIEVRHVIKNKTGSHVFFTRYGHLSKILVHEGQHVQMYQLIGRVGSTGISTGPHLHYEVRDENGEARNPGRFQ